VTPHLCSVPNAPGANCAVDQPDTPVLPQTPADCSGQGCALPAHPGQRAAFKPIIVADCTSQGR
jgi:hypothetical protein